MIADHYLGHLLDRVPEPGVALVVGFENASLCLNGPAFP